MVSGSQKKKEKKYKKNKQHMQGLLSCTAFSFHTGKKTLQHRQAKTCPELSVKKKRPSGRYGCKPSTWTSWTTATTN